MFEDEAQRQLEASTTIMPIDKADSNGTNHAGAKTESNLRDNNGRDSPVTPPSLNFDDSGQFCIVLVYVRQPN